MIVCSWNIRGLNDPTKTRSLKIFLSDNKVYVIAVLETRVESRNAVKIQNKFGSCWSWSCNSLCNPRGRIWLGWNSLKVTVTVLIIHEQFIHGELADSSGNSIRVFTVVYGLNTVETRKPLWRELTGLAASIGSTPLLLLGDFNDVLSQQDRLNGAGITSYDTQDFEQFLFLTGVAELRVIGNFYSWSNKSIGDRRISSRIWGMESG